MQPWDENRLVSALKEGRDEAFRILIEKYRNKIHKIAYAITLDNQESEDIVQEVFIKIYRNIHGFKQDSKLSTWIHRMTVNHCLNWQRTWKRRFRWRHHSIDTDETGTPTELGTEADLPEKLYDQKELEKIIWEKLAKLPEDARAVFVLKEVEGLSYDEISEILKIKRGTVSSRLFHARKRLKEMLGSYMS